MRGSTFNTKPTLLFGAYKALWSPLYIGEEKGS